MATNATRHDDRSDANDLALVPTETVNAGMVMPIATPTEARTAVQAYEALKAAIITDSDIQRISGKNHIKKSGWLRIARAFGLTVEPVSERYETAEDGSWGYAIVVRAVAPNGASMQGDGTCWSTEKKEALRTRHNVRAHAFTRATNRAISNLVGGGEVSAEEMQDDEPVIDALPAWNALKDGDVRLRLQQLGHTDENAKRGALAAMHAAMKASGEPWTKPGVLKRLAVAPGGAASLEELAVGERGN